ncbi:hypothetical protein BHE74_00014989 [Ensete ventricosum]|nr:hypothetical protein BHE74_00014989 [Ensete ventricosum]
MVRPTVVAVSSTSVDGYDVTVGLCIRTSMLGEDRTASNPYVVPAAKHNLNSQATRKLLRAPMFMTRNNTTQRNRDTSVIPLVWGLDSRRRTPTILLIAALESGPTNTRENITVFPVPRETGRLPPPLFLFPFR